MYVPEFISRDGYPVYFSRGDESHAVEDIVMQFTGLLDKNGVEIYEGDIIRLEHWGPSIYKIDFDRGAFYIAKSDREEVGDIKYAEKCEVIGNIYENPELLK
jgi:uncharacterized phage protein (TIGR01671 family)